MCKVILEPTRSSEISRLPLTRSPDVNDPDPSEFYADIADACRSSTLVNCSNMCVRVSVNINTGSAQTFKLTNIYRLWHQKFY